MNNGILNNLTVGTGRWFSDLVDENKLSNALLTKPYEVSRVVSYVFGAKDREYTSCLDAITGGIGNVMEIDQSFYEWNVMIDSDRAVTIRRAEYNGAAVDATTKAGLGNMPIKLWLNIFF